jgi:hypothetical protein
LTDPERLRAYRDALGNWAVSVHLAKTVLGGRQTNLLFRKEEYALLPP